MTILYRKHYRLTDLSDKNSAKKAFPTITYEYGQAATLTEVAKEISGNSGVSEGETISVLKDFRTLLRKLLLSGRSVNIGIFLPLCQKQRYGKSGRFYSQ